MLLEDAIILQKLASVLTGDEFGRVATALQQFGILEGRSVVVPEKKIEKPTSCSKCPYYSIREYRCHNERGLESRCAKGYMNDKDTRDWHHGLCKEVYQECKLYGGNE